MAYIPNRYASKVPRTKTPEQALSSLMRMCARAEKCSGDALRLMRRWGLSDADARGVLERLTRERFIDDVRYAEAYVREKMRFSGWGHHKIRAALRAKSLSPAIIESALAQLSPENNSDRLALRGLGSCIARNRNTDGRAAYLSDIFCHIHCRFAADGRIR